HLRRDEMRDDLGVGIAAELRAVLRQFLAQLTEVLDDAIMHDREPVGRVRVGIGLVWLAVGGPAGMADADGAGEWFAREPRLQVLELAFGAPTRELPAFERSDAGGGITAIFEALERVDELVRNRLAAENPNDPAQCGCLLPLAFPATRRRMNRHPGAHANHNACQPVTTDLLRGARLFAHGFERAQALRPTFLNDLPA